jgi:apolipoprotein N-acyltransferase
MPTARSLLAWVVATLTVFALPPLTAYAASIPVPTEMAAIEATAPLGDQSEEGVKAAIVTAVQKAARGALAMGFPWLRIQSAYVRPGYVGVHVVAMARAPEDEPHAGPDQGDTPSDPNEDEPDTGNEVSRLRL